MVSGNVQEIDATNASKFVVDVGYVEEQGEIRISDSIPAPNVVARGRVIYGHSKVYDSSGYLVVHKGKKMVFWTHNNKSSLRLLFLIDRKSKGEMFDGKIDSIYNH